MEGEPRPVSKGMAEDTGVNPAKADKLGGGVDKLVDTDGGARMSGEFLEQDGEEGLSLGA